MAQPTFGVELAERNARSHRRGSHGNTILPTTACLTLPTPPEVHKQAIHFPTEIIKPRPLLR